ncbi:hypothetical protein K438DRAFT_2028713, partial [Mycena galopus ATCC 62051]
MHTMGTGMSADVEGTEMWIEQRYGWNRDVDGTEMWMGQRCMLRLHGAERFNM